MIQAPHLLLVRYCTIDHLLHGRFALVDQGADLNSKRLNINMLYVFLHWSLLMQS